MSTPLPGRHLQPVNTTLDAVHEPVHEPPPPEPETPVAPLRRVRLTKAAGIQLRPTFWLWDGRIPAGAITLGPGREGIGKSLFCAWLTARVTRGELPGQHKGAPKSVFYAAAEDSWERTVGGRLKAADADRERVYRVEVETITGDSAPLILPKDTGALAEEMRAHDVALLVLDPVMSHIDPNINANSEELRAMLEPLARLADDTGAAVFGLAHFNKATGTDALSRITGSRAFAAVARSVLAFARDTTNDDGTCVMSLIKNNLGRTDVPSLRYRVESVPFDTPEGPAEWGRLDFTEETTTHVNQLLEHTPQGPEERSERAEIAQWLTDYLGDHDGDVPMTEAVEAGQETCGYSKDQLKRAKAAAGIGSRKVGHTWHWHLPDTPATDADEGESREQERKGAGV